MDEWEEGNRPIDPGPAFSADDPGPAFSTELPDWLPWDVLQGIPEAVHVVDPRGDLVFANAAALELLGLPRHQLPRSVAEILRLAPFSHPDGRPLRLEETPYARIRRGERCDRVELQVQRPDGRVLIVDCASFPVFDRRTRASWVVCVQRVVTPERLAARNQAAIATVARAVGLQPGLDSVLDAVLDQTLAVLGADSALIWLADEARRELNLAASRHVRPETAALVWRVPFAGSTLAARVFRTGEPEIVEDVGELLPKFALTRQMAAAERIHSLAVLPLELGQQRLGVVAYGLRSERRFARPALETVRTIGELFAIAIENSRLHEATREEVETANTLLEVARVVGSTTCLEELLDRVAELIPRAVGCDRGGIWLWDEPARAMRPVALAGVPAALKPAVTHLLTIREGQGTLIDVVRSSLVPLIVEDAAASPLIQPETVQLLGVRSAAAAPLVRRGEALGVIAADYTRGAHRFTLRDLAVLTGIAGQLAVAVENVRLSERFRQRVAEIEEERARRSALLDVVAHELRRPLNVLRGYVAILDRWERLGAERRQQALSTVAEQTRRLDRMIGDLLDVARIEEGRLAVEKTGFDLVELASEAVAEQQATTNRHRLILDAPGPVAGEWDRERIAQVLTSLLSNAIDSSPDGGEIRVSVRRAGAEVEVSVQDQGSGLTPEQVSRLFQPGSRLDRGRPGLGLGLFVGKAIVEAHGGRLRAASPGRGRGATFSFTLPREG